MQVEGTLAGVEHDVSVSLVEASLKSLGDGDDVHFLYPPHLQAILLPCSLELFVVNHSAEVLREDTSFFINPSGQTRTLRILKHSSSESSQIVRRRKLTGDWKVSPVNSFFNIFRYLIDETIRYSIMRILDCCINIFIQIFISATKTQNQKTVPVMFGSDRGNKNSQNRKQKALVTAIET